MSFRIIKDKFLGVIVKGVARLTSLLLLFILIGLLYKSWPIMRSHSLSELLFSSVWKPMKGQFGFLPYIISTLYVTILALIIAVPLCVLCAIYLSEYADKSLKRMILPVIDILAGIPSVIFGIWGIIMIVPWIRETVAPAFGYESSGYCILAGGIVLAVSVFPLIIHLLLEVFGTIPKELREASLSLGANKWETIKLVVLKKARPGIIAAVVLGFSRALGETLAVLMVVGNVAQKPENVFSAGYPIPALIANNYGEMMSIPMYDSALMFAALLLFVIILLFNIASRTILMRIEKNL
jgi:phosphate transport system permease protein